MKGTNRWGGGYTDGFVVDLDTTMSVPMGSIRAIR